MASHDIMNPAIFLLAAKFMCALGVIKAGQNDTPTKEILNSKLNPNLF